MKFTIREQDKPQKGRPNGPIDKLIGGILWDNEEMSVPRYFFAIRMPGEECEDDPHGTILPNDAEALSYAERTIRELRREDDYKNQGLMMIVTDETRSMVLALPFHPGSA
jgi:hypothetical protein